MSNPHRTLAFYALALSVIVAWACLGCVVRTANGQGARNPSDGVADRDLAYFPEAMALLDKSDAALGAQRYDDVIALARQVDPKVDEEKVHVEKTVAAGEAEWRIRDAAIVLEGLALRGAGRDLDALLAIRDRNFHAGACGDSLLARCGEHADWLKRPSPAS